MAKKRTSQRMEEQIRILYQKGYTLRAIARVLKKSRPTIRRILFGGVESSKDVPLQCDWELIRKEHSKGVTLKQLHAEYAADVSYLRFWREFRKLKPVAPEPTIRLHHKPAEKTQIDFTDGISIVDRETGVVRKTELFLGVLPFSSYTFGEFVWDQKLPTFISVQERMWAFFGGVTPYVVPDNLKSGVTRAHLYDPDANPTYCDFANHMGFAVLPARPYTPRDKAACESGAGVAQRQFYQEVRSRTFYSLEELNHCFRDYLDRLNRAVMKDHGISRLERFEAERSLLKSLPPGRFEVSEWQQAKVHPDCHIQIGRNFYSVPFRFVGQTVRVRRTSKMIEVFTVDGDGVAAHAKIEGVGKFSTLDAHYPEAQVSLARFECHHAKAEAEKIGPECLALVNELLSGKYPLKYLRRTQGILRLSRSSSKEAMAYAAKQSLTFRKMSLGYFQSCVRHFETFGARPAPMKPLREAEDLYLHNKETP